MLLNLRAKCTNFNGASATYTWRKVECVSEQEGSEKAFAWARDTEAEFKAPDVDLPYVTKSIEVSFPTNEELEDEDRRHIEDKMALENW